MIKSREVQDLLRMIENEPKQAVRSDNLFDNPVRTYLIIKTMFQNFKKSHELLLMQERIFQVKVNFNSQDRNNLTKASAASIFKYHSLSEEDIILLIEMKEYIKENVRGQLYEQILQGIDKLQKVGQIMKCYRNMLNVQFCKEKQGRYSEIEARMINKLSSMDHSSKNFKIIAKNILALPQIKQPILILISQLYQKIVNIQDFHQLFQIFHQNFPQSPTQKDLQALIKICNQYTLQKIIQIVQNGGVMSTIVLQLAEQQAKNKLQHMELTMTSKIKSILLFIVQVVKFGRPIWHQIIQWEHKAAQDPKNFLKNHLQSILVQKLRDQRQFQTVLNIIQKIAEIDQHSQIGLIFVRQLLKLQNKEYLSHRIIRRFLAIKILKYNSSEQYVRQIFQKGQKFTEVILEMFKFEGNVNFYNHIMNHLEYLRLFTAYLSDLSQNMPVKYKQFFLKCNSVNLGQIFGITVLNSNSPLLRLLGEHITFQIAVNLVKDLALHPPSRAVVAIFGQLLSKFKDNKQISILKTAAVRSLNIILIRNSKGQFTPHFKIHLPTLIKENLKQDSNAIFENVFAETIEELKRFYEQYLKKKKM